MSPMPRLGFAVAVAALATVPLSAATVPERTSPVAEREYRHPDLYFPDVYRQAAELPEAAAEQALRDLAALGIAADHARLDVRGGRWGTLVLSRPLIPGDGVGNSLRWQGRGAGAPVGDAALERAAWSAFVDYLEAHARHLRIDVGELDPASRAVAQPGGDLVQIHAPRTVRGIPVRSSFLTAAISHGNLVLAGTRGWGDVTVSTRPQLSVGEATAAARAYLEPVAASGAWDDPELILLPLADGHGGDEIRLGRGYAYRLAWAIRPAFDGEPGRWEVLVDAHDGEVLAFEDKNHATVAREVKGGVYPLMGCVEFPGWPMPFDQVSTPAIVATDSGYLNFLACDDDDGNGSNGTPHMTAIHGPSYDPVEHR